MSRKRVPEEQLTSGQYIKQHAKQETEEQRQIRAIRERAALERINDIASELKSKAAFDAREVEKRIITDARLSRKR